MQRLLLQKINFVIHKQYINKRKSYNEKVTISIYNRKNLFFFIKLQDTFRFLLFVPAIENAVFS